jgi:hypothetical protein
MAQHGADGWRRRAAGRQAATLPTSKPTGHGDRLRAFSCTQLWSRSCKSYTEHDPRGEHRVANLACAVHARHWARLSEARTAGSALSHFLAGREPLLLLDNCEHLLDACAEPVVSLLLAARAYAFWPRAASRWVYRAKRCGGWGRSTTPTRSACSSSAHAPRT